ncbi:VlhA.3.02 variable lipoprotein family domain protein [Mycoplasmoides gallisepticum str. R(high)]|nr:VlhA.3.02 variable lipoprotein family domain protein [Mycoplasmoides gallisepticum str. R(high)]
MLAAASCTSATTPTPNPEPKPDPMPNPPSGGMNGGDTNPGGGQNMMNAASQELEAARMGLTTVFDSKAKNLGLYVGYKKTQQNLTKAYDAAKNVLDNSSSTTQNLNEAKTRLETAIRTAATSKQTFDEQHAELVKVYKELKTTLSNETATLAPYADSQYAGIKMHLSGLYDAGKAITTKTLEPVEGDPLTASAVMMANTKIVEAIKDEVLNPQKENATKLADSFVKQVINKTKITGTTKTENQPGNYSFVGFSNDLDHKIAGNAGNPPSNLPTWNFAQRKVWTSETKTKNGSTDIVESPTSKTDVSWIYSLSGETTKYTLEFIYYGPSTVYLYFPYKLVKSADSSLVALQYKLNGGEQQPITFAADNQQNVEATANKTPTVSDINVAKVSLSGLKFGSNTIELSVPTENPAKVALMIGNIYIYIYIYIYYFKWSKY